MTNPRLVVRPRFVAFPQGDLRRIACATALAVLGMGQGASAQVFTDPVAFAAAAGEPEFLVTADNLPHDTVLTNQYPGVAFGGTARTWDAISFGGGGTAVSPRNVLFNFGAAPMRWTFATPARYLSVFNPSLSDRIRLRLFRADNSEITSIDMETGAVTFAGYIASEGIFAVEAAGIAGSSNFTIFLDNLGWSGACPRAVAQPADAAVCPSGLGAFSFPAVGAGPMGYEWQIQTGPGVWATLGNDPLPLPCGGSAHASPFNAPSTQIGITPCPGAGEYRIRCIATNSCGSITSNEVRYVLCYANCDCSAGAPVLNVNDFICFQQKYAAGDGYANCDGSTTAPVLNVNDFICFQTKFAAGCL